MKYGKMNLKLEPEAKKAIDFAKKTPECGLVMMVDGFITDREALLLRDLLWYARFNGVEVHFVPKKEAMDLNIKEVSK